MRSHRRARYSIGCLARIDPLLKAPQLLILAHTRELAQQVAGVVGDLGKSAGRVRFDDL